MYLPNDKYSALLSSGYTAGQNVLYISAVPTNVPTIIVAAKGTDDETVFTITGKTTNSLTGVARLKGANVNLDANTPLTCLNNEEFITQFHAAATGKATGAEIDTGTEDAKIVTPKAIADSAIPKDKATGAEVDTGTDDAKYVTAKAMEDSSYIKGASPTLVTPTLSLANTTPTADGGIGFDRTNEDLVVGDGSASQSVHMGAWKTWTPTLANITKGSGVVTAIYAQIGKTIVFNFKIVLAADSAIGTGPTFTLPVTAARLPFSFQCIMSDYGSNTYQGWATDSTTDVVAINITNVAGTYPIAAAVTATVPHTWATNDVIFVWGAYEAA